MERPQEVVVAVVVLAVALFGLRAFFGLSVEDESAPEKQRAERSLDFSRDHAEREATERTSGRGDRSTSNRVIKESKGRAHTEAQGGGGVASMQQERTGSVSVATGREAGRRGSVGSSGGYRDVPAGEVAVGAKTESGDRLGPRPDRRSEVLQFLAAQAPSEKKLAGATGEEAGAPEHVVLLSVPLEDSTQAEDATRPIVDKGVEVAEDGVGMMFKEGSVLQFPNAGNARGEAGSIAFDIQPQWGGADDTNNSFVQIRTPHQWENRLGLGKNGRFFRFILTDDTGQETDISVPIDAWAPGEKHRVMATWGDARTALYLDGRMVGQNTYPGQLRIAPETPMYLGSDLRGGASAADATIQNFKVYGRPVAPEETASP